MIAHWILFIVEISGAGATLDIKSGDLHIASVFAGSMQIIEFPVCICVTSLLCSILATFGRYLGRSDSVGTDGTKLINYPFDHLR